MFQDKDIAYEVTISEELRALIRARSASAIVPRKRQSQSEPPRSPAIRVFSRRRLRVDGQRPFNLEAGEILTLRVGGECGISGERAVERHQSLAILLTEDGDCVAHMVAEPPEGTPARPVYILGQIHTSADVLSMIRECRDDAETCAINATQSGSRGEIDPSFERLRHQFVQLERNLAPFVETTP